MVRQVGSARFEIVSGAKAGKITDELSVDVAYADGMDQTLDGIVSDTDECMRDSEPENGVLERMLRGVVVRHLILPGHIAESKKVIRYLYETYGDQIYISIMNQYTPMPGINARYPELGRKLTSQEYDEVVDYAIELGVENRIYPGRGDSGRELYTDPLILLGCEVILLLLIKVTLLCYHRLLCRRICRKCLSRIHCLGSGIRSDCVSSTRIRCCICGSLSR